MICEIYDDLLEPHVAEFIASELRKVHWKYDYNSNKNIAIQPHWHHQIRCKWFDWYNQL